MQAWIAENGPAPTEELPPIDEIPDLGVPTEPIDPVTEEPSTEAVDPVAEAVANWQQSLADAAANWAAAWGQTDPTTSTTLPSTTGSEAEDEEPAGATDPALESTDSARAALVEATQAEPTTTETESESESELTDTSTTTGSESTDAESAGSTESDSSTSAAQG